MRVALSIEQLFYRVPGGTGRYVAKLAATLPTVRAAGDHAGPDDGESSNDLVVFSAWHGRNVTRKTLAGAGLSTAGERLVRLPLPRPALYEAWNNFGVGAPENLSTALRRAEVMHAPNLAVPPVSRLPLVVTVFDAAYELYPDYFPARGVRFHRSGARRAAATAGAVITSTEAAASEIAANTPIPRKLLHVVPLGADQQRATEAEVAEMRERRGLSGIPYVFWVGSLEPRKNVASLVRAMARLAKKGAVEHHLVLAGPVGWLADDLLPEADTRRLAGRLHLLGGISDEELRALYAGADVFCLPSLHEGFGLPVIEAMVQGTAVLCSDLPVLREISAGAAGLVAPLDEDGLVSALDELLGDEASRDRLARAGRALSAGYTWRRTAEETWGLYQLVAKL